MSIALSYHQTVFICKRVFTVQGLVTGAPDGENRLMTDEDKEIRIHNASLLIKLKAGGSLTEFAKMTGKLQSYWSDVLRHEKSFGPKAGRMLENTFQLPKGWIELDRRQLQSLDESEQDQDHSVAPEARAVLHPGTFDQNVAPYAPSTPKRPVMAKVIAGNFREAVPARTPDDEPWEEHPRHSKSSDLAVWLIVDGDSMDDGSSSSFREGDLILVDPDVPWGSGDFVIIANGGDEWTFKRIRKDGPTWYMEALNPGYSPRVREIPAGWRVVAKVLEVAPKGRKVG